MEGETRHQRIYREQCERQAARLERAKAKVQRRRKKAFRDDPSRIKPSEETYETLMDNLGESPDY